ncbi:MAG: DNA repair protein RecO [Methylovulum sp.]|nr:DNA repair protein RecO [Methylovulum sp.]
MTVNGIYLQPGFVLQHRHFRETSLLLDVLTQDYGRVSVIAKGVRKAKSKTAGLLQPFVPLKLSFIGKSELKLLTHVEMDLPMTALTGLALYCGFYLNELVCRFLYPYDPHPEVFIDYRDCLAQLGGKQPLEAALRSFELALMEYSGYGLQLEYDFYHGQPVEADKKYHFNAEQGPVAAEQGEFSGSTLQALIRKDFTQPQVLSEAKLLMRSVIDTHLQGKSLKSRTVINQLIKQL